MSRKFYSKRKEGNRRQYQILVIVCEGEKTERNYFKNYREQKSGLKIEVPNSKDTDPVNLVKFALNQIKKFDLIADEGDHVWCVFDADNNNDGQIQEAINLARDKVNICFSNPCFEIWYLLHYCYYNTSISTQELLRTIKRYIPNYRKENDCFLLLLPRRNDAIKNSKKLIKYHEKNRIPILSTQSNPSTQVHKVVDFIIKTVTKNKRNNN